MLHSGYVGGSYRYQVNVRKETPIYVLVAVLLVCVVLAIFMDSFLVPVLFMVSIGMAIVYNLGTNIFLGEVSYITKALAAVLQLGVTLDYSIFLWHSYKEEKKRIPVTIKRQWQLQSEIHLPLL